jgi:hypothetical protein
MSAARPQTAAAPRLTRLPVGSLPLHGSFPAQAKCGDASGGFAPVRPLFQSRNSATKLKPKSLKKHRACAKRIVPAAWHLELRSQHRTHWRRANCPPLSTSSGAGQLRVRPPWPVAS